MLSIVWAYEWEVDSRGRLNFILSTFIYIYCGKYDGILR